jgi:hypothetical protein
LFPLAPLAPLLLLGLWRDVRSWAPARALGAACMSLNLLLLWPAALHDADPEVSLYAALHAHKQPDERTLSYVDVTNPLGPWHLYPSYYVSTLGLRAQRATSLHAPVHGLLAVAGPAAYSELQRAGSCQLVASRYPSALLERWPSWLAPDRGPWFKLWSLWRCP